MVLVRFVNGVKFRLIEALFYGLFVKIIIY
jgi:hypothetical protein